VALGEVVEMTRRPNFVVYGCQAGDENFVVDMERPHPPDTELFVTSYDNAELLKFAYNGFCCVRISYANLLAELCEKIDGGDVDMISDVLISDPRINRKFLKGGLGYGGPCFPRDDRAFIRLCKNKGVPASFIESVQEINSHTWGRMALYLWNKTRRSADMQPVGFVGITYKQGTGYRPESQVDRIIGSIEANGIATCKYDPDCQMGDKDQFLAEARTLFITKRFPEIAQKDLAGKHVIDVWRNYTPYGTKTYYALGKERHE